MRETIETLVISAMRSAIEAGELPLDDVCDPGVERPRDPENGDWASSVALRCAKQAGMKPRDVAQAIVGHIRKSDLIESVEIAGPGFINMRLSASALQDVLRDVTIQQEDYGRCNLGSGRRIQIEYVSANPTGPMHVGHGRWASLGDSLGNVLDHAGWDVEREFYINDYGNQMNIFAASVSVRYLQICRLMDERGILAEEAVDLLREDTELPVEERVYSEEMGEDSYGGAYIVDIAMQIFEDVGKKWAAADEKSREDYFLERSYKQVLAHMEKVLASCGCHFDVWFSERTLHQVDETGESDITRAIARLDKAGYMYEKEGALWFRSTDPRLAKYKDDKDRVVRKADGTYTYFAADIAYHNNKFNRGFDRVINIWGADHHGYVARVQSVCGALGYDGRLDVIIGQLVNLLRDGVPVRLSKRAGTMVTFEELLRLVGSDATRYLMVNKSADQTIDFDITEATRQDSSNPVFYVQYAHARICSILRRAAGVPDEDADTADMGELADVLIDLDADLSVLTDESELALMRRISEFPEILESAARDYAPFRLTHYAEDLASSFHQFYTRCHVLTDDEVLTNARLYAVNASRIVLAIVLSLLGVSAPSTMHHRDADEAGDES